MDEADDLRTALVVAACALRDWNEEEDPLQLFFGPLYSAMEDAVDEMRGAEARTLDEEGGELPGEEEGGDLVQTLLGDLDALHSIDASLVELHDRIAGPGELIFEGRSPLGEFGLDMFDALHTALGRAVWEKVRHGARVEITTLEEEIS